MNKSLLGLYITLGVIFGTISTLAWEPLVVYDNFDTEFIDPGRWFAPQPGGGTNRDFVREIRSGQLRLADRAYGNTTGDSGGIFDGAFLSLPDPDAVTALGASIRVERLEITHCINNPTVGSTRAELHGTFFNTATPTSW